MDILKRKERAINKLVKKALKDKFISNPVKGFKYLKDLKIGSLFEIPSIKTKGILIECETNAKVIIVENKNNTDNSLGKRIISADTEVKLI
jgi:hypothetical protein|tara:strand:- start:398 stop:670 length:273 start_codon:yes stop_codon:yes gene_type:complete